MRRRRQRNPLLGRIIGVSVLVHIIALPILAHFGTFKKIQEHFMDTRLVTLPPPTPERDKTESKKPQKQAPRRPQIARRGPATTQHTRQAGQKSNLNQPKVIASAGTAGPQGEESPGVDPNGTGKAGVLPTEKTDKTPPAVKEVKQPEPPKKEEVKAEPVTPKVAENPPPRVEATPPKSVETPPVKRAPVFVEVTPTFAPQPTIPDDLRSEALDKTFVAEFSVSAEGMPTLVTVSQSTGNDELDRLALDTARKWRFKPAMRDGEPIASRVRMHIEFQVN